MKLQEFRVGKKYIVKDIRFCDDCPLESDGCTILSLMERGLVRGSELTLMSIKLGMYELLIDNSHILIREDEGYKFNIDVE